MKEKVLQRLRDIHRKYKITQEQYDKENTNDHTNKKVHTQTSEHRPSTYGVFQGNYQGDRPRDGREAR